MSLDDQRAFGTRGTTDQSHMGSRVSMTDRRVRSA
jgi:hypothetical protein